MSDAEATAFELWIAEPEHSAAFAQVDRAWATFDAPHALGLERLRRETRLRLRRKRLNGVISRIAAAVVAAAGLAGLYVSSQGEVLDNAGHTPKLVALDDGSRLTLDARSRVTVRYSGKQRRFDLKHGQASFEVARDPARPFTVRVGDISVAALGTTFNIDRWGDGATVALIEGSVRVAAGPQAPGVILSPGQQVTVQADRLSAVSPAPPQIVSGWRSGLLVFNDASLAQALASVNRHGDRSISLGDPSLGDLRISGIFKAGDTDAFTRGAAELHGLRVEVRSRGITLRRRQ